MMSPYFPLVCLGIAAALFGGGWAAGDHHGGAVVQARWNKEKLAQQQAFIKRNDVVQTATVTQASDAQAIGVQVIHDTEYVHEKAKQVIVKVPVYVPAAADAGCTINAGFIRVWNAANTVGVKQPGGPGGGQQPAPEADGAGKLSTAQPFSLGK